MRTWVKFALAAAGSIAGIILLLVLVYTQTDFGRERVRLFGLRQLADRVHGRVEVARIEGNLLSGATLIGLSITDSAGHPFLRADTAAISYSLRSFFSKRLTFRDVRLVRPVLLLDRPPGGEWNFQRLFPADTLALPGDTLPGFGDWIQFENLQLVQGDITVRIPWSPDSALAPPARAATVRRALSEEGRELVVAVPGGYQRVSRFQAVDALLPLLRLADPDSAYRVADIAELSMVALPFRPPAVAVRAGQGRIAFGSDTVYFQRTRLRLPASDLRVDGWYSTRTGSVNARIRSPDVAFADLRFAWPELPAGGGRLNLGVGRVGELTRITASDVDIAVEDARLAGSLDVQLGAGLRLGPSDLRYDNVDTRLLQQLAPAFEPPVAGVLTGHVRLAGVPERLDVDGWSTIRDRGGATSRVEADGQVGSAGGTVIARDLALRFDPLRLSLVRALGTELPVGGVLTGRATLDGALDSRFRLNADLVHTGGGTGRSQVRARGRLSVRDGVTAHGLQLGLDPLQVALLRRFQPTLPLDGTITGNVTLDGAPARGLAATLGVRHQGSTGVSVLDGDARVTYAGGLHSIDTDLRVRPLALATAGRFAPAAGLHGTASGILSAHGDRSRIDFRSNLTVAGGGSIVATGTLGLGPVLRYDVDTRLADFDPAALSTRAPTASLTGTISAAGTGTSAATARALIGATLVDSRAAGAPVLDTTRLRARLADGLATVEHGHIRLASARADIEGAFGLVSGRSGELRYLVSIDTLRDLPGIAAGDSGRVPPRPLRQARLLAEARADSAAQAQATQVQRAATGQPPPPTLDVDTIPQLPRDSTGGSLRAEGVLAGNVAAFQASGSATLEDLVFRGNAVRAGSVQYRFERTPARPLAVSLQAGLAGVQAAGFAFDSVRADIEHAGNAREGQGRVDVALFQDPDRDYRLSSQFTLALNRRELRIADLTMRFDSTVWETTGPGRVAWAAESVELDRIELRNAAGGRIYADGRLSTEQGSGNLQLQINALQVADVAGLLQDTVETRGLLSLDARLQGTLRAPRLEGELAVDSAARAGTAIPSLRGRFQYAARSLDAQVRALRDSVALLTADVELPVDLALRGRTGPLLPRDAPLRIDARADSLPLEALPTLTSGIRGLRGQLAGQLALRGTFADAQVTGDLGLRGASAQIPALGITLTDGAAALRLTGEQAVLDSLVARSGGGLVRAAGTVDIAQLTRPGFDLELTAADALLLDNEHGRVRADASLAIAGPYERVRVTGELGIERGVIYVDDPGTTRRATNLDAPTMVSVLDTLRVAPELRRLPPAILRNLQADVAVTVARDTWVRAGNTAIFEIYTPEAGRPVRLTVDNAAQAVILEGTINADRGEYTLAGRQFDLTAGSVTFLGHPEPDPLLQLSAQYQVPRRNREALIIQINVGGYLSEPRITLSSNAQPPLPESDLIGYLAFGRSSSSLLDPSGSGITGAELGFIAEQQLAGLGLGAFVDASVTGLEQQGARAGLDVFRVRPAPLPDESNIRGYFQNLLRGMEVEAGKYLTPRFYLSARGRTSGTLPGLQLEWQRPDGFSFDATWEAGYLPQQPSLAEESATPTRVFGAFLRWTRRF